MYHVPMINVYLADTQVEERSALRLMIRDLKMDVIGETADWQTLLDQVSTTKPDLVLVDWGLLDNDSGLRIAELREVCPISSVIVLISHWDPREQAALSAGADVFISKGETIDHVSEHLRNAAEIVYTRRLFGID